MAISLNLESKSKITLSKESKDTSLIWDNASWTWDEATSAWNAPKLTLSKGEIKSKISLSLELK